MSDEEDQTKPKTFSFAICRRATLRCMRRHWLLIAMVSAVLLAVVAGIIIREIFFTADHPKFTDREIMYTSLLGDLFIRVLRAVTIPLFTLSIMSALGSLNMKTSGKIGARTFAFFMSTSFTAATFGLILVILIEPGKSGVNKENREKPESLKRALPGDNILDVFRNFFPDNIVSACLTGVETKLIESEEYANKSLVDWPFIVDDTQTTNYLGLVTVSIYFGVMMGYFKDDTVQLYQLIDALNEIFLGMTMLAVWVSPPSIFFKVLAQIMAVGSWSDTAEKLGLAAVTIISGEAIFGLVFLPILYTIFLRKLPFRFMYHCIEIAATAFATSSSVATMPMTLTILEEKVHIDPRITRFVVPLGATVNMNGAAMYEAVAPIFLAQMRNLPINAGQYFAVVCMAALDSVGVVGIPQGRLVTMVIVMNIVNVPASDISVMIAMDWLLDRFDTMTNVFGDCITSAVVEHWSKKELKKLDDDALTHAFQ